MTWNWVDVRFKFNEMGASCSKEQFKPRIGVIGQNSGILFFKIGFPRLVSLSITNFIKSLISSQRGFKPKLVYAINKATTGH